MGANTQRWDFVLARRITPGCSGRWWIKCQATYGSAPPLNRDVRGMIRRVILLVALLVPLVSCAPTDQNGAAPEHAVLVHFAYGSRDLGPMFALEDQLERAINEARVGEYDGNEIAVDGSDATLYMYGPDADRLFAVVKPILESAAFMRGAKVVLRYGEATDPSAKESEVVLGR
jgi:hypothetical protein